MLILRRKSGESIVIGDNIILTVLDINEGSVRLAIDAPKEITILRSELLQAADANRDSAAAGASPSRGLLQLMEGRQGLRGGVRRRPVKPGAAGHVPAPSGAAGAAPISDAATLAPSDAAGAAPDPGATS